MDEKKNPIEIKGGFSFPIPPAAPIPVTTDAPRHAIRPNVRAALDYLDGIFARGGEDAEALWDVLSALRGPDQEDQDMKVGVTIPVRRAAFPRTLTHLGDHHPYSPGVHRRASFGGLHNNYPFLGGKYYGHFGQHGDRAARALGII